MGQRLEVSSQVGAQQFKGDIRRGGGHGFNALLVVVRTAVGKVVAIDHRDDGVPQVHRRHRLCKVRRLLRVKRWWALDGPNRTKSTTSGAFLPSDHERGVPACPAFVDVGATSLFANGVEFVVLYRCFGGVEGRLFFATWKAGSEPIG